MEDIYWSTNTKQGNQRDGGWRNGSQLAIDSEFDPKYNF